jgi:hypothetical protein
VTTRIDATICLAINSPRHECARQTHFRHGLLARACPRCGYPVGDIERMKRIKLVKLVWFVGLANIVVVGAFVTWRLLAS